MSMIAMSDPPTCTQLPIRWLMWRRYEVIAQMVN